MRGAILLVALLLVSFISSVFSLHNVTEALAALAPVPMDDPESAISLMENDGARSSATNGAKKPRENYGLISTMVAVIYMSL